MLLCAHRKRLRCACSQTLLLLQVGLFRRSLHRRELEDARQQLYANIWAAAQPLSKVAIKTQIGQVRSVLCFGAGGM